MIIEGIQVVTTGLSSISHWHQALGALNHQLSVDWLVLAQQVSDPDILGQISNWWSNFIKSGQVWALIIGLTIGYVFRGMTSF